MLGVPGRMASVQSQGFCGMTLRSSSGGLFEITNKSTAPETDVDRLPPVPGPGLDPVAHRVVEDRDDVQLVGLVLGHVLLERLSSGAMTANCLAGTPLRSGESL